MMKQPTRNRIAKHAAMVMISALLLSSPALADFKRDYGNGVKALNSGKNEKAVKDLEKAIADNGKAQDKVRIYGMRFEPYLPYYYLGEAKFKLGDCQGAMNAWQESVKQGIVQQTPQFDALQESKAGCGSEVVDVGAIAAQTKDSIRALDSSISDYDRMRGERLLASEWPANWQPALDQAKQQSTDFSQRLDAATTASDADAIGKLDTEIKASIVELSGKLEQVKSRLAAIGRQQQNADAEARNMARRELIQAVAAARSINDNNLNDPRISKLRQELQTLAGRGDGIGSNSPASAYKTLARSINTKLREFRQVAQEVQNQQQAVALRKPPASLNAIAVAYFSGDYQQAAKLSDPAKYSEQRERIQAHLFRAAARYNLYVLTGEQQAPMLRDAQQDIRSIKRLDRGFSPYLAAFSPRFLSLFEKTL